MPLPIKFPATILLKMENKQSTDKKNKITKEKTNYYQIVGTTFNQECRGRQSHIKTSHNYIRKAENIFECYLVLIYCR